MTTIRERIESLRSETQFAETLQAGDEWHAGNLIPADEVDARIVEAVAARDAENKRLRRVLKQCYDSLGMLNKRVSEKAQMLRTDINIVIGKGDDHDG